MTFQNLRNRNTAAGVNRVTRLYCLFRETISISSCKNSQMCLCDARALRGENREKGRENKNTTTHGAKIEIGMCAKFRAARARASSTDKQRVLTDIYIYVGTSNIHSRARNLRGSDAIEARVMRFVERHKRHYQMSGAASIYDFCQE